MTYVYYYYYYYYLHEFTTAVEQGSGPRAVCMVNGHYIGQLLTCSNPDVICVIFLVQLKSISNSDALFDATRETLHCHCGASMSGTLI